MCWSCDCSNIRCGNLPSIDWGYTFMYTSLIFSGLSYKIRDWVSFWINVSTVINLNWLEVTSENSQTEKVGSQQMCKRLFGDSLLWKWKLTEFSSKAALTASSVFSKVSSLVDKLKDSNDKFRSQMFPCHFSLLACKLLFLICCIMTLTCFQLFV